MSVLSPSQRLETACIGRHLAPYMWSSLQDQRMAPAGPASWMGSQIEEMRDASGLMYRRNRYYDPSTGRFTQEDPIGIAGGINLYGFANGDPVSFRDPYGLSPDSIKVEGRIAQMNVTYLRNHSKTFRRLYDELDADPNIRILIRGANSRRHEIAFR